MNDEKCPAAWGLVSDIVPPSASTRSAGPAGLSRAVGPPADPVIGNGYGQMSHRRLNIDNND